MPDFPLTLVKPYLVEKGFEHIYYESDKIPTPKNTQRSTLRRGRIIIFLEEKGLLADFIEKHWSDVETKKREAEIKICKNWYYKNTGVTSVIQTTNNFYRCDNFPIDNISENSEIIKNPDILIKQAKPEQLLENIRKAFSKILPVVTNFIGNTLKEKSNNWKNYTIKNLSDITKNSLHLEGSIENFIKNLDILASFHIIINNWNEIFMNKFEKNSRKDILDYIHRLITIRNNIKAHDTMNVTEQYNKDRFDHDFGTMIFFIDHIDKNLAEELREMKKH